jgi:hypothetical protein
MPIRTRVQSQMTLCIGLLALLPSACTSEPQEPPAPVTIEDTDEVSATVEAVNVDTRMVSLRVPGGQPFTVQVSPEVRNLPQVRVGDRVVTRYYKAMAVELRGRGDRSGETQAPVVASATERAPAGAKPAGAVGVQSHQTVRITSVDTKNHVVSFYGSDGLARSLPVRTPQGQEFISKLKTGDEVEVTYTEALAVMVQPVSRGK